MNDFADNMAVALDVLLDHFGDAITYTPPGGSPVAVPSAICGSIRADVDSEAIDGPRATETREITGSVDDVAVPAWRSTWTIAGVVWVLGEADGARVIDGPTWRVRVVRTTAIEKSHPGYRSP